MVKRALLDRHENFKRLAVVRTNHVLRYLRLIGNLANNRHYEYNEEEITKIFNIIDKHVSILKLKFEDPRKKFTLKEEI